MARRLVKELMPGQKQPWRTGPNWQPANGGKEKPFKTRTGRRLLYVWDTRSGDHAYLDLGTDRILSHDEAQVALGMEGVREDYMDKVIDASKKGPLPLASNPKAVAKNQAMLAKLNAKTTKEGVTGPTLAQVRNRAQALRSATSTRMGVVTALEKEFPGADPRLLRQALQDIGEHVMIKKSQLPRLVREARLNIKFEQLVEADRDPHPPVKGPKYFESHTAAADWAAKNLKGFAKWRIADLAGGYVIDLLPGGDRTGRQHYVGADGKPTSGPMGTLDIGEGKTDPPATDAPASTTAFPWGNRMLTPDQLRQLPDKTGTSPGPRRTWSGEPQRDLRTGRIITKEAAYTPFTGEKCTCRPGVERDNCPACEGTGKRIDFAAIHAARKSAPKQEAAAIAAFRCQECGAKVPAGRTICPRCKSTDIDVAEGAPVKQEATRTGFRCRECDTKFPAGEFSCPHCGSSDIEPVDEAVVTEADDHNVWVVHIPANIYDGKYYDYRTVRYDVPMSVAKTAKDADKWVNGHKQEVLAKLDKKKMRAGGALRNYVAHPVEKNVYFKPEYHTTPGTVSNLKNETIGPNWRHGEAPGSAPAGQYGEPIKSKCPSCGHGWAVDLGTQHGMTFRGCMKCNRTYIPDAGVKTEAKEATAADFKVGDRVTAPRYGVPTKGTVAKVGQSMVFVKWDGLHPPAQPMHPESLTKEVASTSRGPTTVKVTGARKFAASRGPTTVKVAGRTPRGVFAPKTTTESAPKGWEGTVKAMKKDKDIDNPWALAHWMKGKGMKSHKKEGTTMGEQLNRLRRFIREEVMKAVKEAKTDPTLYRPSGKQVGVVKKVSEAGNLANFKGKQAKPFSGKKKQVAEKWGDGAEVKQLDKYGKAEQPLSALKSQASNLRDKEERSAADSKKLKQLNFAIRARTGWGKAK